MDDLLVAVENGVGIITLNRPQRRNAFTTAMVNAWADALERFRDDPAVRAIVTRGAGGSFCTGVDIDEFADGGRDTAGEKEYLTANVHRVANALATIDKPVIAAVDGMAIGAGMDMALMCDMRLASPAARFAEGYIKIGLVPGDGGAWLLPRIVGRATALRLLWTGDFVDADEALRLGIVEQIVHDEPVDVYAIRFAERLAAQPSFPIRAIKRMVIQGEGHDLATALDLASSHLAVVRSTADNREAIAAMRERRAPNFSGS